MKKKEEDDDGGFNSIIELNGWMEETFKIYNSFRGHHFPRSSKKFFF